MKTMKKRKTMKKIIALLLTVIIVICSLPMTAFANTLESTFLESENEAVNEGNENWHLIDEQEIVTDEIIGNISEVESLREENVKHFRLPDGTYEAIIYSQPVHRKDKEGVWQDIDNTIELTADAKVSRYATQDLRVSFADRFSNNTELFTLSENGYSISMKLLSNGDILDDEMETTDFGAFSTPTVNNISKKRTSTVFNSIDEAKKIDNKASIVYNNIRNNTNIEYVLNGNDVKENIIVTAPCESYEYVFEITFDGLFAELEANGEISVKDNETDEIKYVIPAPYMYDADGTYSNEVSYTLEQVKDEIYLLVVSAASEWINAEDRAFPVVIDPTIQDCIVYYDSYVDELNPNDNYGLAADLWVSDTETTYMQIAPPSLPTGATFNSAYLYVPYYYHISTGYLSAAAYRVSSYWEEGTITYNNAPTLGDIICTDMLIATSSITESSPGTASFHLTSVVEEWYNGAQNYGIAIKRRDSSLATNQSVILKSFDAYEEQSYLSINYVYFIPDGVYALENNLYTNHWMTVEGNGEGIWAGYHIQHSYSDVSPANNSVFDRSSLFKISRAGGQDLYIIRSMLNNNLSFGVSGTELVTKEIPSADSDVALADTFHIEWDGNSFLIRPYNSSSVIEMYSDDMTNLTMGARDAASGSAEWNLEQYTGENKNGSTIYYHGPLNAGTTVTFTPVIWATSIDFNTPMLSVASGYADKATATWNESTRTGAFVLHDDGVLKVTSKIYKGSKSSSIALTHTFTLTLAVNEGIYFFKNKEVGKYMQINDNDESNYSTIGSCMELWDFDGGDYQKWQLIHVVDGYYKILSVKSGLAVCVKSDKTNDNEVALVQESYSNLDRQQWKITKSSSGAYILRPKSGESYDTDWCMCAGDQFLAVTDGLNVEQKAYVDNDSYKDEWIICVFDTSILLAIDDYDGYSRHTYFSSTKNNLQTEKNGTISITSTERYSSVSVATMIDYLQSSNIFIVHTHGRPNGFKISNTGTTYITLTDLTGQNLSNLSFALLMTCNTGDNYNPANITNNTPVNIIEQMVICGAETVVGFNNITKVSDCNKFGPDITSKLISGGLSVDDAIDSITYTFYIKNMASIAVVAGNGNNKLR